MKCVILYLNTSQSPKYEGLCVGTPQHGFEKLCCAAEEPANTLTTYGKFARYGWEKLQFARASNKYK